MTRVRAGAFAELLKPITWFAPMWAFACGAVSVGLPAGQRWPAIAAGIVLAGPMVCGTSQAVNDWFDRHVDAINEPGRPIPSGRLPGRLGLAIAVVWTALSIALAATLGPRVLVAAALGLVLAWAYSAPPVRLKRSGFWGSTVCAACYEGLPWITGAAVVAAAWPNWRVLLLAALYSAGAIGIMTLNDFKSTEGDRAMGIASLPVSLGVKDAARFACAVMALPQAIVMVLLSAWGASIAASLIAALLFVQLFLMRRFLLKPRELAPWYNGTGTSLYVLGMLVAAFGLRGIG